ncbi:hypothetical protein ZONE111905_08745 [Zobellia nedashkovskayae]
MVISLLVSINLHFSIWRRYTSFRLLKIKFDVNNVVLKKVNENDKENTKRHYELHDNASLKQDNFIFEREKVLR